MTYRLHHVHLICKDLEGMIKFFVEALGATLVARKKFGTADGASLDLQGTTVNLRVDREDEVMVGGYLGWISCEQNEEKYILMEIFQLLVKS